jgi:hypothetical protein
MVTVPNLHNFLTIVRERGKSSKNMNSKSNMTLLPHPQRKVKS